jgi:hypothetical protein
MSKDSFLSWEYDVFGIYNPLRSGPLDIWYEFLMNKLQFVEGDVLEAGVWRGRSLLTSALLLKDSWPNREILGFDSFSGFPIDFDERDEPSQFDKMLSENIISSEHYSMIQKNLAHLKFLKGHEINSRNVSLSEDFSATNKDLILRKADYLTLDNIKLIDGPFSMTMRGAHSGKLAAVLLDCDLYRSYESALNYVWEALSPGGMIYLDEYYSLKFPGARLATLDFFENRSCSFYSKTDVFNGFERWWIIKDQD